MRPIRFFVLLFSILFAAKAYSQNPIGVSEITTYGNLDYKGGTQNWDVQQDSKGIMYFANNEGLLTFDGRHWRLHPLPHKTIVRSIRIDKDGKIYTGGQGELGYFLADRQGRLTFTSLRSLIPDREGHFSDVWNIEILPQGVFFRTTDKIFLFKGNKMHVYKPTKLWEFMGSHNGIIYAQDMGTGLMVYNRGTWVKKASDFVLSKDVITSINGYSADTLLVSTLRSGFFLMGKDFFKPFSTTNDGRFKQSRLYKVIPVNKDLYAVATSFDGCYIINKAGKIIQVFSINDGLHKNNLRNIFFDRNKNLWLGLDDGINMISFNNAIKLIYPDENKQSSTYASLIQNKILYVGTSNGMYYSMLNAPGPDLSRSTSAFKAIAGTSGQVWSLKNISGRVIAGHEDGAFLINETKASQLYSTMGSWVFEQAPGTADIIGGTYTGLKYLRLNNNKLVSLNQVNGLGESLRFIVSDKEYIWSSHPYRGIYRLKLADDKQTFSSIQVYNETRGLPSVFGNYIAKVKGKIVAATEKGIYEYDEKADQFMPSPLLQPILKQAAYHYLQEDNEGNLWFVSHKKVGVVDFSRSSGSKPYSLVYFPELNYKVVAGFVNIYPYNKDNVFIGSNRGLIHINYRKYLLNIHPLKVNLSLVKAGGSKDSILYGGYPIPPTIKHKIELPKSQNSLYFEFSSTLYEQKNNIEFSYCLEGFDKKWSDWGGRSDKDYTNLPYGNYTFKLKARNNLGSESPVVSYQFSIAPAWYESRWTYLIYLVLLCLLIYSIVRLQKKKHLKEKNFLMYQHQLQTEHIENELVKVQNEKLAAEVDYKNKELAATSMFLVQKNKLISTLKKELLPILQPLEASDDARTEIKKAMKLLNDIDKNEDDWEQFVMHFDTIHSNFLNNLKAKFPHLTSNDLKVCAYLKMNLSSKEMAQLLGITHRAVEVSRYRLRKKLNVPAEESLFSFIMRVGDNA